MLYRLSNNGTKLLFQVIKVIIKQTAFESISRVPAAVEYWEALLPACGQAVAQRI